MSAHLRITALVSFDVMSMYVHASLHKDARRALNYQQNIKIRQMRTFPSSTFKYNAIEAFNRVPEDVRMGTIATVKYKLRKWIRSNIPID